MPTLSPQALAFQQVAEGEEMQFRPLIEDVKLDFDVYAIKGADDFYLSLSDFLETLNLPIAIQEDSQTAQGWFLREDWQFDLDLKQGRIQSRGKTFSIRPEDYQIVDGEIFIAGKALSGWMGMTFAYDVSQQYLGIQTEYPLPIVAQMKRHQKRDQTRTAQNVAQLPRKDYDYDWAHLSMAHMSLRTNYKRAGDTGSSDLLNRTDITLNGDLLKHDAYMFINADDRDGLNSITGRLSRASEEPELLGRLKARSYALGDVNSVDVPLTGTLSQEVGVRISNNPLSGIRFQNTRITGNAVPGWDVELYRGNTRIDIVTADETGRYEFTDVQLFAGDNDFDVLFFGDQGEIRRERLSIPLTAASLTAQASTYDFSVGLNDAATYRRQTSQDEDAGTPHIAGQYNFFVGDALAYAGLQALQEEGEQKLYLGSGFTAIWNGFVFDTNLAMDEDAETASRIGARRDLWGWDLALSTELASEEFSPGGASVPQTFGLFGSAQRSYTPPFGVNGNIFLSGNYREYADGGSAYTTSLGMGQGFTRVSLSDTLSYDRIEPAGGAAASEMLLNSFSARGRISSKVTLRGSADYQVKPESRMERYIATLNYRPNRTLDIDMEVEHRPETQLSEGELRANYTHDKFRLSPFLRYDSDNDLTTGLNLSASLIDTPQDRLPLVTSDRLTGQGLLSARVYLDANGNMIFDEGDEPLPDVIVESVNSRRRDETDEKGYALLRKLPVNIASDIHVDNSSLPDPFMLSVNKGHSVLPRPGKIFEMDFPVQFAGEIDGTIAIRDESGGSTLAKFVTVELIPLAPENGIVTAKAAQDGFYILSQIPPGQYFLTASEQDAQALNTARPMPQLLTFTHEGTMFYAQDIVLQEGVHDIGFAMLTPDFFGQNDNREPTYFISVGNPKSSGVLQSLYRVRMKKFINQVIAGLQPVKREQDDDIYYRVGVGGLEAAYNRCQIMSVHKLPCKVSVLPPAAGPVNTVSAPLSPQAAAL